MAKKKIHKTAYCKAGNHTSCSGNCQCYCHLGQTMKGWIEVDSKVNIVKGEIGIKVYRFKKDIIAKGFSEEEIAKIEIKILK